MAAFLTYFRRSVSEFVIRQIIAATGIFPITMLQARALANMRLALGSDVPSEAAQLYFRRIAWWFSDTLTVFHQGIDASPIAEEVTFIVRLLLWMKRWRSAGAQS